MDLERLSRSLPSLSVSLYMESASDSEIRELSRYKWDLLRPILGSMPWKNALLLLLEAAHALIGSSAAVF